ncbi:MAG: GNAT family N-acetyltransferase [Defluviitaleaceae bacterium]|nr:GNAT family N-acetyltransferase [Defluviitaleaceae bacterium]
MMNKIRIMEMTEEYAEVITQWKYDGEYSFYDNRDGDASGYMDGTHFVCIGSDGEMIGYYSFGDDARVPTVEEGVYCDEYMDIGLGLRPDLCGQGFGKYFFAAGISFVSERFGTGKFRLSVAVFNERAIKTYKRAGFYIDREVTNSFFMNKFIIMKMEI